MMPLQSVHRCIVVATALGTLLCPQHATAQIISAPTRDVRSIPKPPIITAITQHDAQLHAPQYQSVFTIHGQHLTDIVSVSIGCCHVSGVNVGGRAEDTVAHVLYTTSKMSRTGEHVKVTTAGGTDVHTFWPLLTVDSLRPRRTGPSQTVTVYGRNLQNGDRMTFAGGLTATLVDHGGQLTVMVPPGARSGPITPPGYNTLILESLEIAPPPIITAITQHDAQLHAPQYQSVFTIHGQHLTDIVSVSIGCCHVSGVNVGGRAEDTVAHVLYTTSKMSRTGEQVKITTAGGTEVLTFWPLLTVDSLRPRRTGASQTVTVYGRNLQNGDRMTFAGGLTATLVDHGGKLTVMVPPGARSGPITPPGYNTLILDSIEIATTVGRVKNPPTRIRPGGASSPVDASAEEGASRTETTSGSVANGSGTFRVDLPTGQVGGTQATFACQAVDGKIQLMITFGGDGGLMGVISGKVSNARPGTHEVFEDEDRGFSIGVTRMTMPMAAYPASAGSVTITEWTKAMIRGTFKYTGVSEDAEGVKHGHAVRGSFNATVALGC